jgi:RNA polymerase sigma-70 factor (ECF subfamily)
MDYSSLFREEYGRIVAALTRLLGVEQMSLAEDIAQDSLLQAMQSWKYGKMPDQPAAWLHRVARNKAIDYLRRQQRFRKISRQLTGQHPEQYEMEQWVDQCFLPGEISDSQLRMIFAACHPSIAPESQVAFVLRTLCGLNVDEIAQAFLTNAETISKRIYRAREKIRSSPQELSVPQGAELQQRLDVVLKAIYLLFNEGYLSSHPVQLVREDLCREAMRLCHLLLEHKHTAASRCKALMALMCFQASRLPARTDEQDQLVLLQDQNRNLWFQPLIQKGFEYLQAAMESNEHSSYHLEACIASWHAAAPSFAQTNWTAIHELYGRLYQINPSPFVAMNKAIAAGYCFGPEHCHRELLEIKGMEQQHLYQAALGQALLDLNQVEQALQHFTLALHFCRGHAESVLLQQKIELCKKRLIPTFADATDRSKNQA